MLPFRGDAAQDKEALVRTEIVQPRGEPIQIDYRLERSGNGWKIFDVNVLGVLRRETPQVGSVIGKFNTTRTAAR